MRLVIECLAQWAGFTALWFLFVFQVSTSELLVGAAAAALTVLALQAAFRSQPLCFAPRFRWLLQVFRLPGLIAKDLWVLLKAMARHITRKPSLAAFQLTPFRASGDDPQASAQRTLALLFFSIPPNSIVLDVNGDRHDLLFHVMQPAPVPKLARELER